MDSPLFAEENENTGKFIISLMAGYIENKATFTACLLNGLYFILRWRAAGHPTLT